jgi:hypothetical protein
MRLPMNDQTAVVIDAKVMLIDAITVLPRLAGGSSLGVFIGRLILIRYFNTFSC